MTRQKAEDAVPEFFDASPVDASFAIPSTWRDAAPSKSSAGVMTAPQALSTAGVQTTERENEGTQTEDNPQPGKPSKKAVAGVTSFVQRASELVEQEFGRVEEEYEVLEPLMRGIDSEQEPATCLYELTPFSNPLLAASGPGGLDRPSGTRPSNQNGSTLGQGGGTTGAIPRASPYSKLVVTSLSWSSTGQTIAASYGRYDISGWCTDRGALVTWNLGRESVKQSKPDTLIDVDVCLMCCAFHPEHPALIAGGTFNGDLYVWDLSQEGDPQRGRSDVLCEVRHQEPICSITWQYSLTEAGKYGNRAQAYRLVTLAADGRVLVWIWHKLEMPLYGYQLLWPAPGLDHKIIWGGTCMSVARDTSIGSGSSLGKGKSEGGPAAGIGNSTFMAGTEGGRIFRCYLDVNDLAAKDFQKALSSGQAPELRVPIKDASYEAHAGPVFGLDCSPFQRDVFLTAGSDGTARLYQALRHTPLLTLEPAPGGLRGVAWSPSRPLVFSVAADDGSVYIYDLLTVKDIIRPALILDASPVGGPVYAQAFNARRPEMFATGDATSIQIWKLPSSLAVSRKGETAILRRISAAEDAVEAVRNIARRGGH